MSAISEREVTSSRASARRHQATVSQRNRSVSAPSASSASTASRASGSPSVLSTQAPTCSWFVRSISTASSSSRAAASGHQWAARSTATGAAGPETVISASRRASSIRTRTFG